MKIKISLTMIVKNEERCLARCLESVKGIVDEMIIVDTGSSDQTKEIAEQYGAKVYDFTWCDDFSKARNYALSKATYNWRLVLDADEWIEECDVDALQAWLRANKDTLGMIEIYNLCKNDVIEKASVTRLLPKKTLFIGKIHEQPKLLNATTRKTNIKVGHDGYRGEIIDTKTERNIVLLLEEYEKNPKEPYILYQIAATYHVQEKYEEADVFFEKWMQLGQFDANYSIQGYLAYIDNCKFLRKYEKGMVQIDFASKYCATNSDYYYVCGGFFFEMARVNNHVALEWIELVKDCFMNAIKLGDTGNVKGTGSYLAADGLAQVYSILHKEEEANQFRLLKEEMMRA